MKKLDAHGKLLVLLCLLMVGLGGFLVSGCGTSLTTQQAPHIAGKFQDDTQLAEAFDQIIPGMTRADDLAMIGFNAAAARTLSQRTLSDRFAPGGQPASAAVQECLQADIYCTGYVFRPRADGQAQAEITLLVMNGRVIHKVFAENGGQPQNALGKLASAVSRGVSSL